METDSPWKAAIEAYFVEFMQFFFAPIHAEIDWRQGYEFLDNELEKIVRDSKLGKRIADKLVKIYLNSGLETWLLIHIEIQGYMDRDFERRMYIYHYRLYDRYEKDIVSLAVLTDADTRYRPSIYRYERWGCELSFKFPVAKVIDYNERWDDVEKDKNPFSMVVMAHLKAQELGKGKETERKIWKLNLIRLLYERGYGRKDILELFRFIDWLMVLPESLEKIFIQELRQIEEETQMPYITSVERYAMEQGIGQGESRMLLRQLTRKFGAVPPWAKLRIDDAGPDELEVWGERILEAASIEEIFEKSIQ